MLVLLVVILLSYAMTILTSALLSTVGVTSVFSQVVLGMFWGFTIPALLLPPLTRWYYSSKDKKE